MPADTQTEPKGTKDRILDATAALFMRYGYTGTGLKQIVADANAPFGSLYHHFPGGKQELGVDVIHRSGGLYGELVMGVVRVRVVEGFPTNGANLAVGDVQG